MREGDPCPACFEGVLLHRTPLNVVCMECGEEFLGEIE